jgi:hypothetical protein
MAVPRGVLGGERLANGVGDGAKLIHRFAL